MTKKMTDNFVEALVAASVRRERRRQERALVERFFQEVARMRQRQKEKHGEHEYQLGNLGHSESSVDLMLMQYEQRKRQETRSNIADAARKVT